MAASTDTDTIQGFTKDGLAEFNAQFHALVDDGKLANVVTLIARHGEIVNYDAYGVLNISATPPVPVKTDSIFHGQTTYCRRNDDALGTGQVGT
jgi:hypothetical protein